MPALDRSLQQAHPGPLPAQAGFAALKFLFGVALGLAGLGSAGVMFGVAAAATISVALAFRPLLLTSR